MGHSGKNEQWVCTEKNIFEAPSLLLSNIPIKKCMLRNSQPKC